MITFDMKIIGKKLRMARNKANFTQEQIGEYLNIDQSLIAKYEKAERPISMDSLDKLVDLFRCTLIYFIDNDNKEIPLEKVALRGNNINGDDLKVIARMNRILTNIQEMELLMEEQCD